MNKEEMYKWIDNASYEQLLRKWRFAPSGDPFFQGEVGDYYKDTMNRKGYEIGYAGRSQASKNIGW